MSYLFVSRSAALASIALMSLAILAGCQSRSGSETQDTDIASAEDRPIADPMEQQLPFGTALQQVGDRVHFALDRHDLSPEAEATLQRQGALLQNHRKSRSPSRGTPMNAAHANTTWRWASAARPACGTI
jgi:hypothetical protein